MSNEMVGILVLILMFILLFMRIPIAISMAIPAILGIAYLKGWNTLMSSIESTVWSNSFSYTLSTIPLFVLMGQFLAASNLTSDLFQTFRIWFGKFKSGLAFATIGSSALLAAVSGSSLATTGTMGVIAPKEMVKAGYDKRLISGTVLAGGGLGILIPPSTSFIMYGLLTDSSIGQLFIAGILPGIVLTLIYFITIVVIVTFNPKMTSANPEKYTWKEKFISLKYTIWILVLFLVVIGGIYFGVFSPTEAAGIGAMGAFLIALFRRALTLKAFTEAALKTMTTVGFLFAIILSAFLLNYVLVITRIPTILADFIFSAPLSAFMIFVIIVILYVILGAIMDTMAMMVVTVPIILPVIEVMEWDFIWFGVIMVLLIEVALISPPIGMNCFVLDGVAPQLKLGDIFKGALIFIVPLLVMIFLVYFVPEIALYLPQKMF